MVEQQGIEVCLEGDEIGVFWTMRALERQGYSVNSEVTTQPIVQVRKQKEGWIWEYTDGNITGRFQSIKEFTDYLMLKLAR